MPGPQPCRCRPFIFCIVGRGLDPSATSRETAVNGISVEEGFIPPVYLPSPLTSAGVGDAAPYSGDP